MKTKTYKCSFLFSLFQMQSYNLCYRGLIQSLRYYTLLVCFGLIGMPLVYGDVEVTNPGTPPDVDIVFQHIPQGDWEFDFSWNDNFEIGQSFQASEDIEVSSISLPITKFQPLAASKQFKLNIYEIEGPAEEPSEGSLKISQSGNLPPALSPQTFLTFIFESPITFKKGHWYTIMLVSQGPDTSVSFPLLKTDANKDRTFTWYKTSIDTYERYLTRSLTVYLQGKKLGN